MEVIFWWILMHKIIPTPQTIRDSRSPLCFRSIMSVKDVQLIKGNSFFFSQNVLIYSVLVAAFIASTACLYGDTVSTLR